MDDPIRYSVSRPIVYRYFLERKNTRTLFGVYIARENNRVLYLMGVTVVVVPKTCS